MSHLQDGSSVNRAACRVSMQHNTPQDGTVTSQQGPTAVRDANHSIVVVVACAMNRRGYVKKLSWPILREISSYKHALICKDYLTHQFKVRGCSANLSACTYPFATRSMSVPQNMTCLDQIFSCESSVPLIASELFQLPSASQFRI
jgi:hypothetical protein